MLRESAEKELVAAGKKVTTLAINKVVGRLAEKLVERNLVREGYEILGKQVTAKLANGQIRYIDRLVRSPAGDIMAVEVKSGGAIYSQSQMARDVMIEKVGATLGNNAPDFLMKKFVQLKTIVRRVE